MALPLSHSTSISLITGVVSSSNWAPSLGTAIVRTHGHRRPSPDRFESPKRQDPYRYLTLELAIDLIVECRFFGAESAGAVPFL